MRRAPRSLESRLDLAREIYGPLMANRPSSEIATIFCTIMPGAKCVAELQIPIESADNVVEINNMYSIYYKLPYFWGRKRVTNETHSGG